jgi:putative membrane protein
VIPPLLRTGGRGARTLATSPVGSIVPAAVTVAGMIATPLLPRGGRGRRLLSNVVVTGLFSTTTTFAARRWGAARTGRAAAAVTIATGLVELVGSRRGVPFGRYRYTGVLRPHVAGVPAVVPLAWFAMALPAREVAHAALGARSSRSSRAVLGAAALTAWDLFLDPQMVREGYWRWERVGRYRGIPLSNFAGWFATGAAVIAVLDAALAPHSRADAALVGQYAYVASMETVGFAVFFRDRLVATCGGLGMLPLAATAILRSLRR